VVWDRVIECLAAKGPNVRSTDGIRLVLLLIDIVAALREVVSISWIRMRMEDREWRIHAFAGFATLPAGFFVGTSGWSSSSS